MTDKYNKTKYWCAYCNKIFTEKEYITAKYHWFMIWCCSDCTGQGRYNHEKTREIIEKILDIKTSVGHYYIDQQKVFK